MILSIKKISIFSIIVILVGATLIWGLKSVTYSEITDSEILPPKVETTVGPIKLTMSLDNVTYIVGEPVNVSLMLTNIGNETITITFNSPLHFDFKILNKFNETIYILSYNVGVIAVLSSITLKTGESFSRTFIWNQEKHPTTPPFTPIQQVEPGTYYVVGQTGHLIKVEPPVIQVPTIIETPKIQIEIKS